MGHQRIVRILLDKRADVYEQVTIFRTFTVAKEKGFEETAQMLQRELDIRHFDEQLWRLENGLQPDPLVQNLLALPERDGGGMEREEWADLKSGECSLIETPPSP